MSATEVRPLTLSTNPVRQLRVLLTADVLVQVRNARVLLITLVVPVVMLVGIGHNQRAQMPTNVRLALALMLGTALLTVITYPSTLARDRELGVLQRLRVAPVPSWLILVSRLIIQVCATLILCLVLMLVGGFALHLNFRPSEYLWTLLTVLLGSALYLGAGQAVVALVYSPETVRATSALVGVGLILLGVFGHTPLLGSGFETIARWSPGGAYADLLAAATAGGAWTGSLAASLAACVGYTAVFALIGVRWFRWTRS